MESKPETKEQAFNLYFQTELPQTKIADLLDINRKTVYLWVKEGQWEYLKQSARQTPGVLLDQFSRQLVALNESILSRADSPYPTKEEANIQRKLSLTIKTLRKGPDPSERVAEMVRFAEMLKEKDLGLLKRLIPYLTEFNELIIPDISTYMTKMKAQYHEDQRGRAYDKAEAARYAKLSETAQPPTKQQTPTQQTPEPHQSSHEPQVIQTQQTKIQSIQTAQAEISAQSGNETTATGNSSNTPTLIQQTAPQTPPTTPSPSAGWGINEATKAHENFVADPLKSATDATFNKRAPSQSPKPFFTTLRPSTRKKDHSGKRK